MTPIISIIVPIYNTGAYLVDCIESIIRQSFCDFELILVDDGSTDNSIKIEEEYSKKDKRIKVLHSGSGGVSNARNMGINHAQGKWILFVDSDDYLLEGALYTLYNCSLKFNHVDFIQAPFAVHNHETGQIIPRAKRFAELDKYSNQVFNGADYLINMTFTVTYPWNSLVKREFIEKHNVYFKPRLRAQEDLLYIIELFIKGAKGVLIKKPTYLYRFGRPGSLTSVDKELSHEELLKRKRLLESLIISSEYLSRLLPNTPPPVAKCNKNSNKRQSHWRNRRLHYNIS